jgi:DnaJ-class molecular chaperone
VETRDFYVVLGIGPGASVRGIRNAYRHLAQRYQPDRAGELSTRFFQDIVDAYRVLSDPERRAPYDEGLRHVRGAPVAVRQTVVAGPAAEPEPLVSERLSLIHDFVAHEPSVDEVREHILRNFTGRQVPKSERLDALNLTVNIPPDLATLGGILELAVPVFYPCPECRGDGHNGLYACFACGTTGMMEEDQPVQLRLSAPVHDGETFDVPLRGLGIHNLFLRVTIRVAS